MGAAGQALGGDPVHEPLSLALVRQPVELVACQAGEGLVHHLVDGRRNPQLVPRPVDGTVEVLDLRLRTPSLQVQQQG